MCAPLIAALTVGSSLMSAVGKSQEGEAAAEAAQHNIAMGDIAAQDAFERAEVEKQQLAHDFLREKATGKVSAAGAGLRIGTGSTLDWENDLIDVFISDKAAVDQNASKEVFGIRSQQALDAAQGTSARNAGTMGAFSSLLSGASKVGTSLYSGG